MTGKGDAEIMATNFGYANAKETAPPIGFNYNLYHDSTSYLITQLNQSINRSTHSLMDDALCSKVRLTISAKNLKDSDVFSKSDPMCVVFLSLGILRNNECFQEVGRTETIMNCLNPEWSKKISVNYYFEEVQKIRFEVYDIDSSSNKLKDHDFLGSIETTLAEIVGAPYSEKTFLLEDEQCGRRGEITIVAEEEDSGNRDEVDFACHAMQVDKKDFFGKSDPFLNIYKIDFDGKKKLLYRTEVDFKTLNPAWKPFSLSMQQLCGGDMNRRLFIECYDHDNDGGHDFIGSCETSLHNLLNRIDIELPLINEKKKRKKGKHYSNSGRLFFDFVKIRHVYSFLDFITGGTQLDFAVAVDMTASNGSPNAPESLHYLYGGKPNEYQIAIHAVADICQHYNKTKIFEAMGFGAKIPGANPSVVHHCFPLNLMTGTYEVLGVPELMKAYQSCITSVILYGPTSFAPLIKRVAQKVADSKFPKDGSHYQVLLIITDGCICDFEATKDAIVGASFLPLSIIIVGVGKSDFNKMNCLDSDNKLLMSKGRQAQRDIVQFVPLRNFLQKSGQSDGNYMLSMALLAKEVLAEIPEQLTSYMSSHGIEPRPKYDPHGYPLPSANSNNKEMSGQLNPNAAYSPTASVSQNDGNFLVPQLVPVTGRGYNDQAQFTQFNQHHFTGVPQQIQDAISPTGSFLCPQQNGPWNNDVSQGSQSTFPQQPYNVYQEQSAHGPSRNDLSKNEPPPPYSSLY